MKPLRIALLMMALTIFPHRSWSEEKYTFDLAEIEKKPYQLAGYVEARPVLYGLDHDAALYRLRFFDDPRGNTRWEINGRLRLEGSYEKSIFRMFARVNTDLSYDHDGGEERTTVYEAYVSAKPSASLKLDAGKKTLKWGKGYAWNPVAFVDRPKDPEDPELAMEGYVMATADWIRSFDGPLTTVAFTPVLFPVYDHVNDDFGETEKLNFAGRLYFFLYDTDLDVMFMAGGSQPDRYGVDFSRNLTTNFEIHGEYAWLPNTRKLVLDAGGTPRRTREDAHAFLVGLRYLTGFDLTTIVEFYHNGAGFDREEMKAFYDLVDRGYASYQDTGNASGLAQALQLAGSGYSRPSAMRNYLYVRMSQKEPFDILYLTPALTCIINTDDGSLSLTPELFYTGITNLELRLRASLIAGDGRSEFGEKQNDYRIEVRAGYFF